MASHFKVSTEQYIPGQGRTEEDSTVAPLTLTNYFNLN